MKALDIKSLIEFLKFSGEQDEYSGIELTEDHADTEFNNMGFDSLSFLNIIEKINNIYGFQISYELAVLAKTPRDLLEIIHKNHENTI